MDIVTILMVLPLLVALTNMLTNVVKGLCETFGGHAKLVAPLVAELLTLAATAAYLQVFAIQATWYWYAGGAVAGGVVAYVAMNGYDGLYEDLIKHLKGLTGTATLTGQGTSNIADDLVNIAQFAHGATGSAADTDITGAASGAEGI